MWVGGGVCTWQMTLVCYYLCFSLDPRTFLTSCEKSPEEHPGPLRFGDRPESGWLVMSVGVLVGCYGRPIGKEECWTLNWSDKGRLPTLPAYLAMLGEPRWE